MKLKLIIFSTLSLFVFSCKNSLVLSKVEYANLSLDNTFVETDTSLNNMILPYSKLLDAKMNEIVGFAPSEFTKKKPESTLGNLLADATYSIAEKYSSKRPDLAIINYGGIRVSKLAKGNITLGKVYEIMPFDNYLVNIEVNGEILESVFNLMAQNGGWPISGASYTIKDNQAINILVQGKQIEKSKTYIVAISDYLANGGDKMSMLKTLNRESTDVLLRDAFIEYFKSYYISSKDLDASIENRVIIYE